MYGLYGHKRSRIHDQKAICTHVLLPSTRKSILSIVTYEIYLLQTKPPHLEVFYSRARARSRERSFDRKLILVRFICVVADLHSHPEWSHHRKSYCFCSFGVRPSSTVWHCLSLARCSLFRLFSIFCFSMLTFFFRLFAQFIFVVLGSPLLLSCYYAALLLLLLLLTLFDSVIFGSFFCVWYCIASLFYAI